MAAEEERGRRRWRRAGHRVVGEQRGTLVLEEEGFLTREPVESVVLCIGVLWPGWIVWGYEGEASVELSPNIIVRISKQKCISR